MRPRMEKRRPTRYRPRRFIGEWLRRRLAARGAIRYWNIAAQPVHTVRDPRDATIAALRAEVERLTAITEGDARHYGSQYAQQLADMQRERDAALARAEALAEALRDRQDVARVEHARAEAAEAVEPFHKDASHIPPDYRDGWNDAIKAVRAALARQERSDG